LPLGDAPRAEADVEASGAVAAHGRAALSDASTRRMLSA
jgi:hypothetical protein